MRLLSRILALLLAAVCSILAAQYMVRRLYHRWHEIQLTMNNEQ